MHMLQTGFFFTRKYLLTSSFGSRRFLIPCLSTEVLKVDMKQMHFAAAGCETYSFCGLIKHALVTVRSFFSESMCALVLSVKDWLAKPHLDLTDSGSFVI